MSYEYEVTSARIYYYDGDAHVSVVAPDGSGWELLHTSVDSASNMPYMFWTWRREKTLGGGEG